MENKAIAHFLFDNRLGGPHSYVFDIKRSITDYKYFLIVPGRVNYSDFSLFKFKYNNALTKSVEYVIHFFECIIIGLKLPKVWHIHSIVNISPILSGILLRKTCIIHIHETNAKLYPYFYFVKILKKCFKNIVVISVVDEITLPLKIGVDYVHRGFVDTDFWNRDSEDRKTFKDNFHANTSNVIMVSNLNPGKGVRELLHAVLEYGAILGNLNLKIVGAFLDNHMDYVAIVMALKAQIESIFPTVRVNFLGSLDRVDLRFELFRSDIFISTSKSEAFPISILEAMSMSLPIISTDVGDVRKVVDYDARNILIPNTSAEEIRNAILSMLGKTQMELIDLGVMNRKIINQKFCHEVAMLELMKFYNSFNY